MLIFWILDLGSFKTFLKMKNLTKQIKSSCCLYSKALVQRHDFQGFLSKTANLLRFKGNLNIKKTRQIIDVLTKGQGCMVEFAKLNMGNNCSQTMLRNMQSCQ